MTYSLAVFPRQGMAFFTRVRAVETRRTAPASTRVWQLNLDTDSKRAETPLHGDQVLGDPRQQFGTVCNARRAAGPTRHCPLGAVRASRQELLGGGPRRIDLVPRRRWPRQNALADVLDHAASGGRRMVLSPDGLWLGITSANGWNPKERLWAGPTGRGLPVFSAQHPGHVASFFPRGQFSDLTGLAFNPLTGQIAMVGATPTAGRQSVEIAELGSTTSGGRLPRPPKP